MRAAAASGNVIAVGFNCVAPSLVDGLLTIARGATDKAPPASACLTVSVPSPPDPALNVTLLEDLCVYPNSGEQWDAREGHRCWHDAKDPCSPS